MRQTPLTRVLAIVLASPIAIAPAAVLAEQHTGESGSGDSTSGEQSGQNGGSTDTGSASGDAASGESDRVIATVGDAEITTADIEAAVNALPPQMREQMPAEMLAQMAVDQLVLREMILQDAESDNLGEDPEVQQLVEENQQRSEEDAIVQVYVSRALEGVVTDESVQAAYDEIAAQTEEEVPPLEAVRPQVEQQVRQRKLAEIRDELRQQMEITYYGPDGEPQESAPAGGSGSDSQGGTDSGSSSSDGGSGSGSGSTESGSDSGGSSGSAN
jgi:hypothetical protein